MTIVCVIRMRLITPFGATRANDAASNSGNMILVSVAGYFACNLSGLRFHNFLNLAFHNFFLSKSRLQPIKDISLQTMNISGRLREAVR